MVIWSINFHFIRIIAVLLSTMKQQKKNLLILPGIQLVEVQALPTTLAWNSLAILNILLYSFDIGHREGHLGHIKTKPNIEFITFSSFHFIQSVRLLLFMQITKVTKLPN